MARDRKTTACFTATLFLAIALSPAVVSQDITIDRPGDREFIRDLADIIELDDETKIRETCDKLLTDQAIPIFRKIARMNRKDISPLAYFWLGTAQLKIKDKPKAAEDQS